MNSLVLVAFAVGLACGLEVTELNGTLVMHVDRCAGLSQYENGGRRLDI